MDVFVTNLNMYIFWHQWSMSFILVTCHDVKTECSSYFRGMEFDCIIKDIHSVQNEIYETEAIQQAVGI
jgi:hypothetical protein